MSDKYILHEVCSELREEYQSGLEDGIVIKTDEGEIVVHEYVVGFVSKYFRTLIKNSRTEGQNAKINVDYKLYPHNTVKASRLSVFSISFNN